MIFTIAILIILWLCLFVFIESYYERMKTRDIVKSVITIKHTYGSEDFDETLESLAFKNNMCIVVTDKYGNVLYSNEMMAGKCLIHSNYGQNLYKLRNELLVSDNKELFYSFKNTSDGTKMLVYSMIIGDKDNINAFVYLNTLLEPIDSSTKIIKRQLLYVTFITLILAFIITLFISKKFPALLLE